MVTDFCREISRRGMIVDAAIHTPDARGDDRNHHVHILVTMRSIDREGFGNKVREWNQKQEYERWQERWSEIGARQLERAGFHEEAKRFRSGHLSRPEQIRLAKERGDTEHYERLLNEKQEHRGPQASALELNGISTRLGDINREAEARNGNAGITREIREAYALSKDPLAFTEALAEKSMMVARITKGDERKAAVGFALENQKYTAQYREGEYVIATEQGSVYRLSKTTTGDNYRNIRSFTKALDQQDYPSLEAALQEMRKRSLTPQVDRAAFIDNMARLSKHPDTDRPRTWLPENVAVPNLRGEARQVWWAYNSSRTPEDFRESLKGRGLHLARVTGEDAEASKTYNLVANRQGTYSPILRENEYIAVSDKGMAVRLHEDTVGHSAREVRAFMAPLDTENVPSVRALKDQLHNMRMQETGTRPYTRGIGSHVKSGVRRSGGEITRGVRTVKTGIGKAGRVAGGILGLFSILDPGPLTPEQRLEAQIEAEKRREAARHADRKRKDYGRER